MKKTVLNTFAVIGIVTTFVLACSAALDDDAITIENTETVVAVVNDSTTSESTTSESTTSESTTSVVQSGNIGKYQLVQGEVNAAIGYGYYSFYLLNTETAEIKRLELFRNNIGGCSTCGSDTWVSYQ